MWQPSWKRFSLFLFLLYTLKVYLSSIIFVVFYHCISGWFLSINAFLLQFYYFLATSIELSVIICYTNRWTDTRSIGRRFTPTGHACHLLGYTYPFGHVCSQSIWKGGGCMENILEYVMMIILLLLLKEILKYIKK